MKVITTIILGLLFFVANSLQSQDYQPSMEEVILNYERIGQKLSAGSTDAIDTEAQTIITITSGLLEKKDEFPEKRSRKFGILLSRINQYTKRLIQAKNLEDRRIEYDVLSHPVIAYVKMFGPKKHYYIFACEWDMNLWIQSKKEPQADPYCDTACGMVIGEIPLSKESKKLNK